MGWKPAHIPVSPCRPRQRTDEYCLATYLGTYLGTLVHSYRVQACEPHLKSRVHAYTSQCPKRYPPRHPSSTLKQTETLFLSSRQFYNKGQVDGNRQTLHTTFDLHISFLGVPFPFPT